MRNVLQFRRRLLSDKEFLAIGSVATPAQLVVLFAVAHGKSMGMKALGEELGVTSSAATQLVDGLVEARLLVRTGAAVDRRAVTIALSGKGRRLVATTERNLRRHFERHLAPFTDGELATLERLQKKLLVSLNTH